MNSVVHSIQAAFRQIHQITSPFVEQGQPHLFTSAGQGTSASAEGFSTLGPTLGSASSGTATGNAATAATASASAGSAATPTAAGAAGTAGTAASTAAGASGTTTSGTLHPPRPSHVYVNATDIGTVVDLFLEFDVGWKGGPAIRALEAAKNLNPALNWHGTKEMGGHANCKAWIRRKFIIKGIQKIAREKNIPESDVAVRLENKRLSEIRNKKHKLRKGSTLNSMNDLFKAGGAPLAEWLDSHHLGRA
ncbi:hypothetical protein DFS34DRAFT_379561 [Phlyctochytrium arcticum]|nr:hypothetical protein DFS34DRAFT_379561 [Phlyctochytrium arcticum]